MRRRHHVAAWVIAAAVLLAPAADALAAEPKVTVRRSAHGIPHILAGSWEGLGYGYGRAIAEDNICVLADVYVTVRAERSKYFGPDKGYVFRGNGSSVNNLNSDFFFKRIIDQGIVERLSSEPPPNGPVPAIRKAVRGYVAGYNDYLRETGVDRLPDPTCRGAEWVKPIEEIDAYRRFYQLALLASSGVAIDGIGGAQPLTGSPDAQQRALGELRPGMLDEMLGGLGSNAYGLGSEATRSGGGMVLGNPHFPWDGAERFYQAHATFPKKGFDAAGGSLLGVPVILIGHTRRMAWSHTVSTARRFTIFEEKLVPGSPTTYLVDGQPRQMKATRVTVDVRQPDGSLKPQSRTLYETEHGWVMTGILGLPIFPWTPTTAYTMGDANAANFRYLNHFFFTNQAQTVDELDTILRKYQGIPWVNTIAADSRGKAYYADIGAVPHVTDEKIDSCSAPLGVATDRALAVQILDGARSACNWGTDEDAAAPGILGPGRMPHLFRDDFTSNMNDSYWLTNPEQPLEGFPRIIGNERTVRSPRTRLGIRIAQQRLDGSDGNGSPKFTLDQLQDAVFNNRQYLGEQWRDELVAMCEANPTLPSSSGQPVDVSGACPVLAAWDLRDDVDSRGAILFRRFAGRALSNPGGAPVGVPGSPGPWREPFDVNDPVNTPRGLNTNSPQVRSALADAVRDLEGAKIPLDAPLGEFQTERRGDEVIPIHGGPGGLGVFNAIAAPWDSKRGYPDIVHGSSFVQAVELSGRCPTARTILTYSQSTNPESPHYGDQTRMYSKKRWNEPPFCRMAKGRYSRTEDMGGGVRPKQRYGRLLRPVRVRGARVVVRTTRRARVLVTLQRGERRVRTVALERVGRKRVARVRFAALRRKGTYALRVTATAGKRTHELRRTVRRR